MVSKTATEVGEIILILYNGDGRIIAICGDATGMDLHLEML